jgi:hypothetical protein
LAAEAPLIEQDLMDAKAAPQPSTGFAFSASPSANGFDFGLSQPKTGLGYGLLGDIGSLAHGHDCTDCAPSGPCSNCSGDDADAQGKIIKTQVPIPVPGLFPPPITTTPSQPSRPPIIGDPNAFWNRPLDDLFSWAGRPTEEQRARCQDEYDTDMIDCKTVYAVKGTRNGKACEERAFTKYVDCVHNDGQKGIQPYWRRGS